MSQDQWMFIKSGNILKAKTMIKRKKGSIINIASMSGIIVKRIKQHYNSSKAGVIHLTKSLAMDWVEYY